MGLVLHLTMSLASSTIQIVGTYWPTIHHEGKLRKVPGSIHHRLLKYASAQYYEGMNVLEIIQMLIGSLISETNVTHPDSSVMVMGDFNQQWRTTSFRQWAHAHELQNAPCSSRVFGKLVTYQGKGTEAGTVIDHILHRSNTIHSIIPLNAILVHGDSWQTISDHNLLIVSYGNCLELSVPRYTYVPRVLPTELQFARKGVVRMYTHQVQEWTSTNSYRIEQDAEGFLDELAAVSVKTTQSLLSLRKRKPFQIHNPPSEYVVYQGALRLLQTTRRRIVQGQGLAHTAQTLEGFVRKYSSISGLVETDVQKLLDIVDMSIIQREHPPSNGNTMLSHCQKIISRILSILNRIRRQAGRQKFKAYFSKREKTF